MSEVLRAVAAPPEAASYQPQEEMLLYHQDQEPIQQEQQTSGLREAILRSRPAILGTTLLAVAGVAFGANSERAEASTPDTNGTTIEHTTTQILIGKSKESVRSAARAQIVGNFSTVSRAKIKKAERHGDCRYFSGKQAIRRGVQTQGYNGTGVGYAQENRGTTACDTNGDGKFDTRAECGNRLRIRKPHPKKARATVWVNKFSKGKVVAKSKSVAKAKASCEIETATGSVEAYAYGRGVGYGRAAARVKAISKGKGKLKGNGLLKLAQRSRVGANVKASSAAKAVAEVRCEQHGENIPPTPPTPPVLLPPNVEVDNPNHVGTNGVIAFCERESDADGYIVNRSFQASRGNFISNVYAGNDPDEYCRDYRGPSSPQDVTLSVEVADNDGLSAEDSTTFPVVELPK